MRETDLIDYLKIELLGSVPLSGVVGTDSLDTFKLFTFLISSSSKTKHPIQREREGEGKGHAISERKGSGLMNRGRDRNTCFLLLDFLDNRLSWLACWFFIWSCPDSNRCSWFLFISSYTDRIHLNRYKREKELGSSL